ncbi:cyclin-dependent kinase inhibitor 1Ca [Epinephelus fuscoguttatus]|uniref:cyclin-dependent kinase inhibitor 1Ca n=1 Tax=Epinephelus fuscoguttatus TaxID=293821 RepID=UPI0020D19DDF|nr:cyclin-dependent kinase inhibitor 1Ca [Epinephelus fuscoguttatus]
MNPIRRKESVCRSLFGPVDHEQLRRDLKLKMKEITEQDSRRWNFNFQAETPLPGRFQWEWEEMPADRAAAVYQESAQIKGDVCPSHTEEEDRLSEREEGAGTDQENCSSISNTRKRPAEVTPVRRKRTRSKPAAKPSNNARITDFFAKRRRSTETKSILNPFHTSSSEAALCKTLR